MRERFFEALRGDWDAQRREGIRTLEESAKEGGSGVVEGLVEMYNDAECVVDVSEADRDPYGVMIRRI